MKSSKIVFNFLNYRVSSGTKVSFNYRIDFPDRKPLFFEEVINFKRKILLKEGRLFLEALHIMLGITYYKLYCPKEIRVPYSFSKKEASFWNTVYRKGLGEFLFKNNLNPNRVAKFPYSKGVNKKLVRVRQNDSALLGIGGGKDSVVSLNLLKDFPLSAFLVETQREDIVSRKVIEKSKRKKIIVKRTLDKKIFEKHEGSYNGHIPISLIFAFIGIFTAFLNKDRYVIVGNEYSSSFGNLKYHNEEINHQWSKSKEAEVLVQDYLKNFITPDIIYFSILRPFYEIKIGKLFSRYKEYFNIFSSCNKNFRVSKERPRFLWCNTCPKCIFTFLILSPFLKERELLSIFKENLFEKEELIPLFRDILGIGRLKPFDCVGTFEESRKAFLMASLKYKDKLVIKRLLPKIKCSKDFFSFSLEETIPSFFNLFLVDSVAIVGHGREGKVSEEYILRNHPKLRIGILDEGKEKNALRNQSNYDFAIKTSGIPKEKITIPYTTGTNIFFSRNRNFLVGITGTKGKSTTCSILYQILKEDKRKVRLIGNIGKPMLKVLLSKVSPDEIFIIELSSYMLDDILYSPNISVLLNLSPEHMDYHNGVENYYKAKKNIFKFQNKDDVAINTFKKDDNFEAATKIAKILNVSDKVIKRGIDKFKPLEHRMEKVGTFQGITFYNDAAGTTPNATIRAIKALKDVDTLLLGGKDRGYDFSLLEKTIKKYRIKNLVLFPDNGRKILSSLEGFNFIETRSMKEAVSFSFKNTKKGKISLLSTASPSYSIWKNFEEKGELFKKEIINYEKKD